MLGLQLVRQDPRLDELAIDVGDLRALHPFELGQLQLALAVLLLARELVRKLLEPVRRRAPDGAQLEIREALVALVRAAEVLLERGQLLLDAHRGAFLQLEAVEQPMALVVERAQLLLQFGAIAEQRDEALVVGGKVPSGEAVREAPQAVSEAHTAPGPLRKSPRSGGRAPRSSPATC